MSHLSFVDFGGERLSLLLVAFMNGVEDCPVNCLSSFSFVSTLLAKSIASLRLFTLIKVKYSLYGRVFFEIFQNLHFSIVQHGCNLTHSQDIGVNGVCIFIKFKCPPGMKQLFLECYQF